MPVSGAFATGSTTVTAGSGVSPAGVLSSPIGVVVSCTVEVGTSQGSSLSTTLSLNCPAVAFPKTCWSPATLGRDSSSLGRCDDTRFGHHATVSPLTRGLK